MRGWVDQAAAFHDLKNARTYAGRLLGEMAGHPDPNPLVVEVVGQGHDDATGPTPDAPVGVPAAA